MPELRVTVEGDSQSQKHPQRSVYRPLKAGIGLDNAPRIPLPGCPGVISGIHLNRDPVQVLRPADHDLQYADVIQIQVGQHPDERDLIIDFGADVIQGVRERPRVPHCAP
jgi:hypothetical protein